MDREVEAVDSGESAAVPSQVLLFMNYQRVLLLLRVPDGEAVGFPSEGDAVWKSVQGGAPHGQVLLG